MSKEVMRLALDALNMNNDERKSLADSKDAGIWSDADIEHYRTTSAAICALGAAIARADAAAALALPDAQIEIARLRELQVLYQDKIHTMNMALPDAQPVAAPALQSASQDSQVLHDFKNFHQNLCKRFGYCHDEKDWRRDLVSLIEHIATPQPVIAPELVKQLVERFDGLREMQGWPQSDLSKEVRAILAKQAAK